MLRSYRFRVVFDDSIFHVDVLEPVRRQVSERAVRRQRRVRRLLQVSRRELALQQSLSSPGCVAGGLHLARLTVPVPVAGPSLESAGRRHPDGDVAEGTDRQPWPRHLSSPPIGAPGRTGGFPLLGNPGPHVGDGELQMLAESVRRRAFAPHTPVVDRGDRYAQVGRQLVDVHQGFQAPRVGGGRRGGGWVVVVDAHTQKVRTAIPDDRAGPKTTSPPRMGMPFQQLRRGVKDGFVMG